VEFSALAESTGALRFHCGADIIAAMDPASSETVPADEITHERAQVLAAVKFMGLSVPAPIEAPPPSLVEKVRSLLFRA
jgi:hypothetical protein